MQISFKPQQIRLFLIAIAVICLSLIAGALYFQLAKNMLPCPLCVLQRYAFLAIALFALFAAFAEGIMQKVYSLLALISTLAGAGVAGKHLYVLANPDFSCGMDPLETSLNKIFPAQILPTLFRADGLCETPYPPIFGLDLPAWAAIAFIGFAIGLIILLLQQFKQRPTL